MSLRTVTFAAAATAALGAVVSIDRGLPADFAGVLDGDPTNVAGEFLLWRGTAIAPPLPLILALAVLAFLVPRDRRALWLLTAIGVGGVVGYLGEPQTWDAQPLYTPLVVAGVVLFASIAVMGARELRTEAPARAVLA